jgi:hypothetical protein
MNAFNNGECVWWLCGGSWMQGTVMNKIDGEKQIGNLKIIASNLDPLYELKHEKDNKFILQHASCLQRKSGEASSQQLGAGFEASQQSFGQQQQVFNQGEKCGFSFEGKCCCGTVKKEVPEKEEKENYIIYNSKKDPYYMLECNDGSIFYVPTSILKKNEQLQHGQPCGKGTEVTSGVQSGLGSQTGEHLAGSQGQTGFVGSQQTGLGSQQPLSQHDVKNVPIE